MTRVFTNILELAEWLERHFSTLNREGLADITVKIDRSTLRTMQITVFLMATKRPLAVIFSIGAVVIRNFQCSNITLRPEVDVAVPGAVILNLVSINTNLIGDQ